MIKKVIFVLFGGLLFFNCTGQKNWSLEECVNHALKNNISIEQLRLSQKFVDLDVDQATHARYPSLNAGSSLNWNFGRTIDPVTNAFSTETFFANNLSLNTGVVIYNGGRIKNNIKQAEINQKASGLDVKQMERDIALLVANAYLNVLFAKENQKIVENQNSLTVEQLKQLEKLISAGTRPANERLNLDAQIANNEQSLIAAENAVATAQLNLKQLLQLPPDQRMELSLPKDEIPIKSDADVLTFLEVYESALRTQPNIAASQLDLEAAAVGVDIAEAAQMPSITAGGSLGTNYSNRGLKVDGSELEFQTFDVIFNNVPSTIELGQQVPVFGDYNYFEQIDDNLSLGAGVQMNIPIYNNHINKNNIERAKLNIENIKLSNQQLQDNLKTNVQQALADARNAKRAYAAAQLAREAQKGAFANAEKRYELGSLNTYNYIDAKNQLDVSELNLIIAKYDYIFKSKVIDFYMGHPLKLN